MSLRSCMGQVFSEDETPPEDLGVPENWRLEHVKAIHKAFIDNHYDFGMDRATFDEFIREALPTAAAASGVLWDRFDKGKAKVINAVEVMAGLTVRCIGQLEDKIAFIFELHDFNRLGSLTYDETVVMIYIAVSATVLISKIGVIPEEAFMENITDEAFVHADIDLAESLTKEDFSRWIIDFLRVEDVTAPIDLRRGFLKRFKALKAPKMGEAGVSKSLFGKAPEEKSAK